MEESQSNYATERAVPLAIKPTVGRIVLVRPQGQTEELPAIVTRVHSDECIDVRAFPNNSEDPLWVTSCTPQHRNLNAEGYGWRWPPHV